MAIPWGPIISAGASLIGSLFGGGSKKQETKTKTVNRVDYQRMVRDAEAAGFNPLTALRNGGAAGFSISNSTSTTPAAPLSARLADGLNAGVQSFLTHFDPHADAMREKQYALIDAQVRNLDAASGAIFPAMPGGFHTPSTYGGTFEGRASGKAGQLSRSTAQGNWDRMNSDALGLSWGVNPANTPAQEMEDQYGEIPSGVLGTVNWLDDLHRAAKLSDGNQPLPNYPEKLWQWWNSTANADYEKHKLLYTWSLRGGR